MQVTAPPLMPVFRSALQAQLLARVLGDSSRSYTGTELAQLLQADPSTVHRETTRLVSAGILNEERAGRTRVLRADVTSRTFRELRDLAVKTYGPAHLAPAAFAEVPGVERVVVFGSWAARFAGRLGHPPRDLDVLLVGSPDNLAMNRAADRLSQDLDLPVSVSVVSADEWDGATLGLVREILRSEHLDFPVGAGKPAS